MVHPWVAPDRDMDIKGKKVFLTGGTSKLGRHLALALASRGAEVAIHYNKSVSEAKALEGIVTRQGGKAITTGADLRNLKELKRAFGKAWEKLCGIDVLINNASIFLPTPLDKITNLVWDKFLDINLKAPFYLSREFVTRLGKRKGKIINIADNYSHLPSKNYLIYGISKAALVAMTRGMAKAFAPSVTVNAVSPGPMITEADNKEGFKTALEGALLKEGQRVEAFVNTVLFLIENDYITGEEIFVDGGRALCSSR